eukprot:gnl/TRDRNA2_/TRDRNA2_185316_c0_seq1.p2 gnl/TRDRNA2_/TRDRNA2_185316_c0~~gnl/TRDRNA2_/TRDRNA2_185316_c0_seq1.p2  ORF type:complete len:166 (-),score=62.00 gnl/TRDRNA2_/TRDRNA2_185316_c0_seq1:121-618(-)
MGRLEEATFLVKLAEMYEKNRNSNSVYTWFKRFQGRKAALLHRKPKAQADAAAGEEPQCLVRACTNKRKPKISTVIPAQDVVRFQISMGNIVRLHMDGLLRKKKEVKKKSGEPKKKKEHKKKEKGVKKDSEGKAEPAEKPKEKAEEPPKSPKKEAAAEPKKKQKK